ncbi:MAG: ribonuclease HII [Candidatus Omnitrophica bacterium]|nr:ribonuclease HII [Candidatus Omnitrophota bacterium]MBU1047821.1 ribonuclease HII [Candidatus Omnitrophota bacterium]MBU1630842.1 ribonuclease HII [Candidatus Omnitrophota bacterium]MBU1767216.1 ribonuclease HII [Candidatus Omnitrophota bacterium]MBU1888656.1 ribonuclease HII [Candidatus Omnitrophota bacterium]
MPEKIDITVYERNLWQKDIKLVAGIDEAGRGPLAGPVVAAVVIFSPFKKIEGVKDSKKLSPSKREQLFELITKEALDWGVGIVSERTIEEINILQATRLAMLRAIKNLKRTPEFLLIDGPISLDIKISQKPIIGGDGKSFSIGAASIIAKVTRDRLMQKYHKLFPKYGFDKHNGYGTRKHLQALQVYGPCSIHRRTYEPVKKLIKENQIIHFP